MASGSAQKAHGTSDGPEPLHRRSPDALTSTSTSTPNARRTSAAHDPAKSNASGGVSSCASILAVSATRSGAGTPAIVLTPSDPGSGDRESLASIIDDPFFQRFDSASDESSTPEQRDESNGNSMTQRRPPPRRESLTVGSSQRYWSHSISVMESYNIAVIGMSAVGKSSFIQRALGLPRPPISNASRARMDVDNVAHTITLLELDPECFKLNSPQPISWPKQVNGYIVPRVDAALVLYDVMNHESIRGLSQTVAALTKSDLSAALVACKCDHPKDDWQVNVDALANLGFFKPCIASYEVSVDRPDVSRACLQTIIRAAVARRRDGNGDTLLRRRAQSAANLEATDPDDGRPPSNHGKHNRASSDFSALRGLSNSQTIDSHRTQASKSPRLAFRVDGSGSDSFFELEESDGEYCRYSDDIPILQRGDDALEKKLKVTGVTFDELVDRLLALRLSRADNHFSDIFICLYRKFAAPGALFSAILVRLDRVRDDKTAHYLTKTATQLRIIEVVAKWVSLYPGDFARPTTRRNLEDFIMHLSTEPVFSMASQQMRRNILFNVTVDDDTGWENADDTDDEIAMGILPKEMSELSDDGSTLQFNDEADGRPSNRSEASGPSKGSSISSQFQFSSSYEEYEREAALLEPKDHLPMDKFRYHIFMDISDDDIADELTRIDWIMFSSIRIRDFIRHVTLSSAQKEKCKSLRNVDRMTNHFNHIAKWVANMILLRDKTKHRAQMLEKFMNIALKLRILKNYNGLAAVLAGINSTAIHRLAQTRALVDGDVQKRFAGLVILMGTEKSHFAYRLAWENSPLPRIPFIPLHRRDLVSAEEGSKTYVGPSGDRINWRKFEVLGEVLLPIMKSQGSAYPNLAKNDTARNLILGCRMPVDDEDIYQRSLQVESNSSGSIEPIKKKFPWFAK